MQLALGRKVQEFVVRNAAPQEERKSRSQLDIGDAVFLTRLQIGRLGFLAKDEFGISENASQGHLDAVVEIAAFVAPLLIEAHQGFEVLRSSGAAESSPRESGN